MVLNDISELNLEFSLHDIRMMSIDKFEMHVKAAYNANTFEWLVEN